MRFKINGLIDGPELDEFRGLWKSMTTEENNYLRGDEKHHNISTAQQLVVDLYTGNERPYLDAAADREIIAMLPAQMEMEALFRARSRALAEMLGRR